MTKSPWLAERDTPTAEDAFLDRGKMFRMEVIQAMAKSYPDHSMADRVWILGDLLQLLGGVLGSLPPPVREDAIEGVPAVLHKMIDSYDALHERLVREIN